MTSAASTEDLTRYGYSRYWAAGPNFWLDPEGLRAIDTAQAIIEVSELMATDRPSVAYMEDERR